MIQHAFSSAYTNQIAQQNQIVNTAWSGIKDAATLIAGGLGFSGALGEGVVAQGAKHALAGRVGGIGGNIMLASLEEKKKTQKANAIKLEFLNKTIEGLKGNPINDTAIAQLQTVAEKLSKNIKKDEEKEKTK